MWSDVQWKCFIRGLMSSCTEVHLKLSLSLSSESTANSLFPLMGTKMWYCWRTQVSSIMLSVSSSDLRPKMCPCCFSADHRKPVVQCTLPLRCPEFIHSEAQKTNSLYYFKHISVSIPFKNHVGFTFILFTSLEVGRVRVLLFNL